MRQNHRCPVVPGTDKSFTHGAQTLYCSIRVRSKPVSLGLKAEDFEHKTYIQWYHTK